MSLQPTELSVASPLFYIESGGGEPVVLLHGLGADSRMWKGVATSLSQYWRFFTPDLPGHGRSPKPVGRPYELSLYAGYVARWLDALQLGPVRVVGHALGGAVAVLLALRRPNLVSRVVAVNPIRLIEHRPAAQVLRLFMRFGFAQALGKPSVRATSRFLEAGMRLPGSAVTPELIELYREASNASTRAMALTNMQLRQRGSDLFARLPQVHCPVYLYWGERDLLYPGADQANLIGAQFQHGKLKFMLTGHLPMFEQPREFAVWLDNSLYEEIKE